jgi:hypothetical protein
MPLPAPHGFRSTMAVGLVLVIRFTPAWSSWPMGPARQERLARVLTCDPGIGVARHADAGYSDALQTAARHGVRIPMVEAGQ